MVIELLIFFVVASFLKRGFYLSHWNHLPGLSGWSSLPWIGHGYRFGQDVSETLLKLRDKYGDVFRCDIAGMPTIIICDYDLALEAYKKEVSKL